MKQKHSDNDTELRLASLGLQLPDILLPRQEFDYKKWAVIACDQFTQDISYWEKLKTETEDAPSTLNLIFPEVYLNTIDETSRTNRINSIHTAMNKAMEDVLISLPHCPVYIERSTPYQKKRHGLVIVIDLEMYDWQPASRPLIRATEGTVTERLPPRMEIRKHAPLETSHVLLLIDDEEDALIPDLGMEAKKNLPLYTTSLMMDSGAITGWQVNSKDSFELLASGLEILAHKANERYGVKDKTPFLFAVGDGNHSLAAAKAVWDDYKANHAGEKQLEANARRYALVEIENLHDPGISFEPIHRVIFGADPAKLLYALSELPGYSITTLGEHKNIFRVASQSQAIAAVDIEPMLEDFLKNSDGELCIDYIHGKDELIRIVSESNKEGSSSSNKQATGIILPAINKKGFFKTIAQNGPLPRKSFSMGEACEKRFYIECRTITG